MRHTRYGIFLMATVCVPRCGNRRVISVGWAVELDVISSCEQDDNCFSYLSIWTHCGCLRWGFPEKLCPSMPIPLSASSVGLVKAIWCNSCWSGFHMLPLAKKNRGILKWSDGWNWFEGGLLKCLSFKTNQVGVSYGSFLWTLAYEWICHNRVD